MVDMSSEAMRRANSRAKARRDAWRERYDFLGRTIRNLRDDLRANPSAHARLILASLRKAADEMMLERDLIARELRATAYTYADKPTQ